MFSFASSLFLVGCVAAAVPLVLHFLRRRPTDKTPFPSFYFMREINAAAKTNWNSLKKWLVLLMRCAAVSALAAAFALPFVPEFPPEVSRAVVVLVDSSMSMRAAGSVSCLDDAVRELNRAGEDTVVAVAAVGDTTIWEGGLGKRRPEMEAFIRNNCFSDGASSHGNALAQASAILSKGNFKSKAICLVTDMQALPWRGIPSSFKIPSDVELKVVVPGGFKASPRNVWIEGVSTDLDRDGRLKAHATVVNGSGESVKGRIKVSAGGGSEKSDFNLDQFGREVVSVELSKPVATDGSVHGRAELEVEDDLACDNKFYFPVGRRGLPVAMIGRAGLGKTDFVAAALAPDLASACAEIRSLDADTPPSKIAEADLVILRGGGLTDKQAEAAAGMVEGGGVLAVCSDGGAGMSGLMSRFGVSVRLGGGRGERVQTLGDVNFDCPLFKVFSETRAGNLYDVAFFNPPRLVLPAGANILAEFSDGTPAIAEIPHGKGMVFVLAFKPDRSGADWPARATFLPFWQELVKRASARPRDDGVMTASTRAAPVAGVKKVVVVDSDAPAPAVVNDSFLPRRAGVFWLETDFGKRLVCVNPSTEESDLRRVGGDFKPSELVAARTPGEDAAAAGAGKNDESRKYYSWAFLAAALLFGCGELLLANRTSL